MSAIAQIEADFTTPPAPRWRDKCGKSGPGNTMPSAEHDVVILPNSSPYSDAARVIFDILIGGQELGHTGNFGT